MELELNLSFFLSLRIDTTTASATPSHETNTISTASHNDNNNSGNNNEDLIFTLRFALEGILVAIICKIGICGNLLSMFILLRKKLDLQPFLCRYS